MIKEDLLEQIHLAADAWKLDRALVCAIVMQETKGNPWLTRFEPNWQYWEMPIAFASSNSVNTATERMMQSMSWGPMQIMGSVAREMGFGAELTRLALPEFALAYSCKKLAAIFEKHPTEDDAIAAWNAGSPRKKEDGTYSNQAYVDGVHGFLQQFRPQAT